MSSCWSPCAWYETAIESNNLQSPCLHDWVLACTRACILAKPAPAFCGKARLALGSHAQVLTDVDCGPLQELQQDKADPPTVIEGFFIGVYEAKGLDRSGSVVR